MAGSAPTGVWESALLKQIAHTGLLAIGCAIFALDWRLAIGQ